MYLVKFNLLRFLSLFNEDKSYLFKVERKTHLVEMNTARLRRLILYYLLCLEKNTLTPYQYHNISL